MDATHGGIGIITSSFVEIETNKKTIHFIYDNFQSISSKKGGLIYIQFATLILQNMAHKSVFIRNGGTGPNLAPG